MIGLVAVAASALWFGSVSLLVGAPALLAADLPLGRRSLAPGVRRALLAVVLVALAAAEVRERDRLGDADHERGGGETVALSAALGLLLALRGEAPLRRPALLAVAALGSLALSAAPFSSHSAGAEWPLATITVHALHHVAIALWFGGLVGLLGGVVLASRREELAPVIAVLLAGFSRRAPAVMAVVVATGTLLAVAHLGGWPALLATRYGLLLLAKLALLGGALAVAARIRARLVPEAGEVPAGIAPLRRALGFEAAFGGGMLGVAALLAETVPGAHDTISWWLPFRLSVAATWRLEWVPERVIGGAVAAFLAASTAAGEVVRGRRGRGVPRDLLAVGGSLRRRLRRARPRALPRALRPLSRRRRPRRRSARDRHGASAGEPDRAAYGRPHRGRHVLVADARDSRGRHAAVRRRALARGPLGLDQLPARVRRRPSGEGARREDLAGAALARRDRLQLRDRRWRARDPPGLPRRARAPGASVERMRTLREWLPAIRERDAEVLAVPLAPTRGDLAGELSPLALVVEPSEQIASSYLLFRRTFESPGDARDEDRPEHLELLVDRFGYVRARWRPDERRPGFADRDLLLAEIAALAAEPEILPPPDDHVH
jgi:putative copper export protein